MASLDDFREKLLSYFTAEGGGRAKHALADYFNSTDGYTGSQFELLADRAHPDEITAQDLVAVGALSVTVPIRAALWLLSDDGRSAVTSLLRQVPADLEIWEPDAARYLSREGEMWRLWDELDSAYWPGRRAGNGMGRTLKSKLLAAKRPRLVPVLDRVVCDALPSTGDWWEAFRAALADAETRRLIADATASAPDTVSLLRRIDIVVWMSESGVPEQTAAVEGD